MFWKRNTIKIISKKINWNGEAFCLFYLAKKLNRQATSLLTVVDSKYDKRSLTSEEREQSLNDMISLALESVSNKN